MNKHLRIGWDDFSTYRTELYGFAALWVMLFHSENIGIAYTGDFLPLEIFAKFCKHGNMGVDIFLFLSGMSLYFAYSKHRGTLLDFQKRRFLRLIVPVFLIYGPYWIYWVVQNGSLSHFVLKLFLLDFWALGSQQIWFVSFIALCYLAYPYTHECFSCPRKQRNRRLVVLLGCLALITYCMWSCARDIYDMLSIGIGRIPIFIIGCWAGKLVKDKVPLPKWTVPLAYLAAIYWMFRYVYSPVTLPIMRFRYEYIFAAPAFMVVFIHLARLLQGTVVKKVLDFCGARSLELYISHVMLITVYRLMPFYTEGSVPHYALLLCCAVAVAWAAERLGSKLIHRLLK